MHPVENIFRPLASPAAYTFHLSLPIAVYLIFALVEVTCGGSRSGVSGRQRK